MIDEKKTTTHSIFKSLPHQIVSAVDGEENIHSTHTFSPLLLDYVLQPRDHLVRGQRAEAKPGAARLQGRDDLGQVVTDQTESSVFCKLLNH